MRGIWEDYPTPWGSLVGHLIRYTGLKLSHRLFITVGTDITTAFTRLLSDNSNTLRFVRSGFLGNQNDAQILNFFTSYRHKSRKSNTKINKHRVIVEHVIREIKLYRAIGTLWRHPRYKIRQTVNICAALSWRRKRVEYLIKHNKTY